MYLVPNGPAQARKTCGVRLHADWSVLHIRVLNNVSALQGLGKPLYLLSIFRYHPAHAVVQTATANLQATMLILLE